MSTSHTVTHRSSTGDAAASGLVYGLAAGLAMVALLAVLGLLQGQTLAATAGFFSPSGQSQPLTGLLGHLAVSGVYGAIFGIVWRLAGGRLRLPAWLAGLVYGVLLWGVAQLLARTVAPALAQIAPWALLAGHLVYGLALGVLFRKR